MKSDRFLVLDSLRGLCAVIVAFFHFPTTGIIANLPIVRNGWLFVDFFFVLSGFVIAAAYRRRIAEGYSARRFMWNRFWRLYPLHISILCLLLVSEVLFAAGMVSAEREPFGPSRSLTDFFYAATFLNSFGLTERLSWNGPSWSIGAEWWAYAAFAAIEILARTKASLIWMLVAVATLAVSVHAGAVDRTFDWGVLRALLGFSVGTLTFALHSSSPFPLKKRATVIEALVIVVASIAVMFAPVSAKMATPFVFAAVVYTFAGSGGILSKVLETPILLSLGALSYSIYMWQVFLQARLLDSVRFVLPEYVTRDYSGSTAFTGPAWMGDALALMMLVLLIALSALSYRYIELPGQRFGKESVHRKSRMLQDQ